MADGYGFGQFGAGPFGLSVESRQFIGQMCIQAGQESQLQLVDTYSDGTEVSIDGAWTSSNPTVASVDQTGAVTGLAAGVATISLQVDGILLGTTVITVQAPTVSTTISLESFYRSHRTQTLLNYFPDTDQRVREEPYTIDAQLLNCAAMALDDSQLRVDREISASVLATCPSGLDNGGTYYSLNLPSTVVPGPGQIFPNQVTGVRGGKIIAITPYDDRLPIPSNILIDTSRSTVAMPEPLLFDVTGSGDTTSQVWNLQSQGPFALALPNRLTFWVENVESLQMNLNIFIQGSRFPTPVWVDQQSTQSETVLQSNEGYFTSAFIWQNITAITVRGLPAGVRLRCWQMPFNLPAVPDPDRPYTHPVFRDVLFDRYWQVSSSMSQLQELYMMDNFATLEYAQSYALANVLTAIAVEPHTWGMFGAVGSRLFYWDRREPMPAQLGVTALSTEPLYGIDVRHDILMSGALRYVRVTPVPYGGAVLATQWRYLVQDPTGNTSILNLDGSLTAYSGRAGWQNGSPTGLTLPLTLTGTYVFTLECIGGSQSMPTSDSVPYPNFALQATVNFDLSAVVPTIQGLSFDALGQLWAWTGTTAVPLVPQYDAYILDSTNNVLYLTDNYDSVTIQ